jgi:hypothetical protein
MSNTGIFLSSAGNPGENGVSGGVHSPGSVILLDSEVSSNSSAQFAGGVGTFEGIISKYSTIANNDTGNGGGGVYSLGNAIFQNSTIEGNTAGGFGGGAILYGNGTATTTLTMTNSTVSGNTAAKGAGLMFADYAAQIGSSTIAFNVETGATKYGAGVYSKSDVALESTIVGANSIDSGGTLVADDIGGPAPVVFSGHSNLVTYVVGGQVMPADTLYENPELAALANNGGLTRTHMLLPNSPAIDAGNNEVGAASDQRGSGFPRVINGRADIGAVEFSDVIFANGFD